jgi:hypothetical protein
MTTSTFPHHLRRRLHASAAWPTRTAKEALPPIHHQDVNLYGSPFALAHRVSTPIIDRSHRLISALVVHGAHAFGVNIV